MWSFFRRPAAVAETRSLASPDPMLREIFGLSLPAAAGVTLTGTAALRVPSVRAAAMAIAETAAVVPVKLFRRVGEGRQPATDHPAYALVHNAWSPWCSAYEGRLELTLGALLHGRAFARVIRTGAGVRELHPLEHGVVKCERDQTTGEPIYRISRAGGGEDLLRYPDVLELRASGGLSPILDMKEAIGLSAVLEGHAARLFANGGRPTGVLKVPQEAGKYSIQQIAESWAAAHAGANSGKTAVLEGGVEFEAIAMSSADQQFLEMRRFQVHEIARALRVPLPLVGDIERATSLNAEALAQSFLSFGLLPWLEAWVSALTRSLLTPDERAELYFEPIVDDLLRADIAKRFEAYAKAIGPNGSFMTPNEIRARENLPPIEGGDMLAPAAPASLGSSDDD